MILSLGQHPFVLLSVIVMTYPICRALARSLLGGKEGVRAAVKHLTTPETWNILKDPQDENLLLTFRLFLFAVVSILFVAASYDLCVRFI